MFLTILLVQGFQTSPVSQSRHFLRERNEQRLRLKYLFRNKINSLTVRKIVVEKNENWLIIIVSNININCVSYFVLSYLYLFLGGKHICLEVKFASQGKNGKTFSQNTASKAEMPTLVWKKTTPSVSSLIGRVLPIYRRKIDGVDRLEMDTKVLLPAPISHFINTALFLNCKVGI